MKQAIQQGCVEQIFSQNQQFKHLINKQDLLKVSSEKKQKKAIYAKNKSESLCGFFFV